MKIVAICMLAAILGRAEAETIDTTDHISFCGRVVRLDKTQLIVTARYPSPENDTETKTFTIPRSKVTKIEFNNEDYNRGGPPFIAVRPGDRHGPPLPAQEQDAVENRIGEQIPCADATIDENKVVHCGTRAFRQNQLLRLFLRRH